MDKAIHDGRVIRFGTFEVDLPAGELRKSGVKLKLTGQPFQVLAILLERPGEVVTREELQKRLWPDTFVDVDHNLNTAINKIREVLGDSAESPRFVETSPRRGYRFIAPLGNRGDPRDSVGGKSPAVLPAEEGSSGALRKSLVRPGVLHHAILFAGIMLLGAAAFLIYQKLQSSPVSPMQRALTRLTFDAGLQFDATWSPDSRFIAYSSDRGGKFDIWVQQVSGGDPVQITKGPGRNWQPNWSPDGKYIAYRSEDGEGGLFITPALGGAGLERKITSFGYHPRWSPDSSQILFQTHFTLMDAPNRFYVMRLSSPPREILGEFLAQHKLWPGSVMWHPDGKRVSVWVGDPGPSPSFWTLPITGGVAIKTEIPPTITKELSEVARDDTTEEHPGSYRFSWSPSGKAVYFERAYRGAENIWKMTVDSETLRATAVERLTTGPRDTEVAVSPDGRRLAFTAKSVNTRPWIFSFDATSGSIRGNGQALTSPGTTGLEQSLSRDGKKMAFCGIRAGRWALWEKSLVDGREAPIFTDDHFRFYPQWSPDGMQLVYTRAESVTSESQQLMVWSSQSHTEEPLTAVSSTDMEVYDWSLDGKQLLVSQSNSDTQRHEVWVLPLAAAPHAEAVARKIISDPAYGLWQPHFSPDSRWIVLEAVAHSPTAAESTLYVIPTTGGSWIRITDGKHWDDKPRWSPDGKTIYFVSGRGGFFNVWRIRFDLARGRPIGEAFRVTEFDRPSLKVPEHIPPVALSLNQNRLVLTMEEVSGSIWVLDNVGP